MNPESLGNGIHLIPLPLPFKSPQWVNAYVVETSTGLLLLDCGTDWEPGHTALHSGFESLGLDLGRVETLVVSHLHPDHVGMASRLRNELGCRFVMHHNASKMVPEYNDTPAYYNRLRNIAQIHGVPETLIDSATAIPRPDYMPAIDPPDHTVADGDVIPLSISRGLEVIHTPGHDPAHICLRDTSSGVVFSGDHVLPRISPVIMYESDDSDALGDYMDSLDRLVKMGIATTYPAHGSLMDRGDERARQILLHHDRRLVDMADLVGEGETTAWKVMLQSFRPNLDPIQARLAFLETLAHLERLVRTGRIHRTERSGRVYYSAGRP